MKSNTALATIPVTTAQRPSAMLQVFGRPMKNVTANCSDSTPVLIACPNGHDKRKMWTKHSASGHVYRSVLNGCNQIRKGIKLACIMALTALGAVAAVTNGRCIVCDTAS